MELLIPIVIVSVLLLVGATLFLLRGRGDKQLPAPGAPQSLARGAEEDGGEPDGGEPRGGTAVLDRPLPPPGETDVLQPPVVEPPTVPTVEAPAPAAGRMVRLRARLARSNTAIGRGLLALLSSDTIDEQTWEDVEDTLLLADLGVPGTEDLVQRLRQRVRVEAVTGPEQLRAVLREELLVSVRTDLDRSLNLIGEDGKPAVALVVGVNGTGKTTTVGKLGRLLVAQDRDVMMGAADTFRAAAAEQLQTWGERVAVPVVRGPEGADPAAVAFDAVKSGIELEVSVVLIDTAGRLHTKVGLMDELGKVKRVIEKLATVSETLLVLDATTGQNGMNQARVFADVVDISGIVLTKLDGTAKGGIVVAVQQELGVPVKLVGLGEGPDDLAPFDPEVFVDALVAG